MKLIRIFVFALICAAGATYAEDAIKQPTPGEAKQLIDGGKGMVLDVREPDEFAQGHLKVARNVPLSELKAGKIPADLPKDKTLYLHCREGNRAKIAAKILNDKGYDAVPMVESYEDLSDKGGFEKSK